MKGNGRSVSWRHVGDWRYSFTYSWSWHDEGE